MSGPSSQAPGVSEVIEEALEHGDKADPVEVAAADARLEELLQQVADVPPPEAGAAVARAAGAGAALAPVAMRTATPVAVRGRTVVLHVRGVAGDVEAELGPGVSAELVRQAVANRDVVLLECLVGAPALVVGVVQSRLPDELVLKARKIRFEGDEELLLRSGRGAMRIRRDGDIELVGSRIAAMSRGLFRLVGRVLRLN